MHPPLGEGPSPSLRIAENHKKLLKIISVAILAQGGGILAQDVAVSYLVLPSQPPSY